MTTDLFFNLVCGALIASLFGLALTFAGYKFFRVLLPIWGFFFGLVLGAQSIQVLFNQGFLSTVTSWTVGFVVGLLFAALSYPFYLFAVALISASLGYLVVVGIWLWLRLPFGFVMWIVAILVSIAFVVATFALKLQKWVIIVATSLLGAGVIVGVTTALFNPFTQLLENPVQVMLKTSPLLLILFLVLVIFGIIVQARSPRQVAAVATTTTAQAPAAPSQAAPTQASTMPTETPGAPATAVQAAAAAGAAGMAAAAYKAEDEPAPAEPAPMQPETQSSMGMGAVPPIEPSAAAAGATGMAAYDTKPESAPTEPEPPAAPMEAAMSPVAPVEPTMSPAATEAPVTPPTEATPPVPPFKVTSPEEIEKFKYNLEYIEGIGPVYAGKLGEIGVNNPLDLLEKGSSPSGREDIATAAGISPALVLKWVNHVDLFRIKGVGSEYADLLEASGVDTVVELAVRIPEHLHAKILEVNEEKKLVRQPPALSQVQEWVVEAKSLPRKVSY